MNKLCNRVTASPLLDKWRLNNVTDSKRALTLSNFGWNIINVDQRNSGQSGTYDLTSTGTTFSMIYVDGVVNATGNVRCMKWLPEAKGGVQKITIVNSTSPLEIQVTAISIGGGSLPRNPYSILVTGVLVGMIALI